LPVRSFSTAGPLASGMANNREDGERQVQGDADEQRLSR
jgi:hypothetical protein